MRSPLGWVPSPPANPQVRVLLFFITERNSPSSTKRILLSIPNQPRNLPGPPESVLNDMDSIVIPVLSSNTSIGVFLPMHTEWCSNAFAPSWLGAAPQHTGSLLLSA